MMRGAAGFSASVQRSYDLHLTAPIIDLRSPETSLEQSSSSNDILPLMSQPDFPSFQPTLSWLHHSVFLFRTPNSRHCKTCSDLAYSSAWNQTDSAPAYQGRLEVSARADQRQFSDLAPPISVAGRCGVNCFTFAKLSILRDDLFRTGSPILASTFIKVVVLMRRT